MNKTSSSKNSQSLTCTLTGKELCEIISACKEAGVSQFSFGELQMLFGEEVRLPIQVISANDEVEESVEEGPIDTGSFKEEEDPEDIEQMLLIDPLGAEEAMARGELELDNGAG